MFASLFSLQQSLPHKPLPKMDRGKELCGDLAWKITAAKEGGLSSPEHIRPEGHNGSPEHISHTGQHKQPQHPQSCCIHPSLAASSCQLSAWFCLCSAPRVLSHLLCPPLGKLPEERADKGRAHSWSLWKLHASRVLGFLPHSHCRLKSLSTGSTSPAASQLHHFGLCCVCAIIIKASCRILLIIF